MSRASIDKKVTKGLKKAGKILGWSFSVYRPDNYVTPLSLENKKFDVQMSWSEDDSFGKNPATILSYNKIYADHTRLKAGDILDSVALARTFVVTEINPLRGAVAVAANDRMTVKRVVYTPTEDVKTQSIDVFTSVPCAVEFKANFGDQGSLAGVGASTTGHRAQVEIWTWMPAGSLQSNDKIELSSGTYTFQSLRQDASGTYITARSTTLGI